MRLFRLELKRILKTKATLILLALSLLLTFVMAYIPTTFSYVSYVDESGNAVTLRGMEAIRYTKQAQAVTSGAVTPEKLRQAVEDYQAGMAKYGVQYTSELPKGVYAKEFLPTAALLHGTREAFADPLTGMAPDMLDIAPEKIDDFYGACEDRLTSLMKLEQDNHPAAQEKAKQLYSRVETPYQLYPGYNVDALDYQLLLAFLIVLFCAVIAAPVFASDYQTRADDILRCTKQGRGKLALTKIASALVICTAAFSVCAALYVVESNCLYGWECTKTSIQMLFSIVNLTPMNLGQLQWACAGGYLLSLLATVSFTLYLSSKLRSVVAALAAALLCCVLPIVVNMALPSDIGMWIYTILPAGGVALQSSFLYALVDYAFWNIGNVAIWTPYVMLGACCIEIPLFLGLSVRAYCKHRVA